MKQIYVVYEKVMDYDNGLTSWPVGFFALKCDAEEEVRWLKEHKGEQGVQGNKIKISKESPWAKWYSAEAALVYEHEDMKNINPETWRWV
jgi:hypothetical protein